MLQVLTALTMSWFAPPVPQPGAYAMPQRFVTIDSRYERMLENDVINSRQYLVKLREKNLPQKLIDDMQLSLEKSEKRLLAHRADYFKRWYCERFVAGKTHR